MPFWGGRCGRRLGFCDWNSSLNLDLSGWSSREDHPGGSRRFDAELCLLACHDKTDDVFIQSRNRAAEKFSTISTHLHNRDSMFKPEHPQPL